MNHLVPYKADRSLYFGISHSASADTQTLLQIYTKYFIIYKVVLSKMENLTFQALFTSDKLTGD